MSTSTPSDSVEDLEAKLDALLPLHDARDQLELFDPEAYFNAFYKTPHDEGAMTMVLFFLPSLAYRLPKALRENGTMLDVGSGPTIHIPIAFRDSVARIYLSDYCADNRLALHHWWKGSERAFDWTNIITWIQSLEATGDDMEKMMSVTRRKMTAILPCDVFTKQVITVSPSSATPSKFDVVSSVFCLEYATQSMEEYKQAVDNVLSLVNPSGFVIVGGVCDEDYYKFNKMRFKCHNLKSRHTIDALERRNFCVDEKHETCLFKFVEREGIFVMMSQRMA